MARTRKGAGLAEEPDGTSDRRHARDGDAQVVEARLGSPATSSTAWPNLECRFRTLSECEFGFLRPLLCRVSMHAPTLRPARCGRAKSRTR